MLHINQQPVLLWFLKRIRMCSYTCTVNQRGDLLVFTSVCFGNASAEESDGCST